MEHIQLFCSYLDYILQHVRLPQEMAQREYVRTSETYPSEKWYRVHTVIQNE